MNLRTSNSSIMDINKKISTLLGTAVFIAMVALLFFVSYLVLFAPG